MAVCRGWCRMHYSRWCRHGDPQRDINAERRQNIAPPRVDLVLFDGRHATDLPIRMGHETAARRILARLAPNENGCWIWQGTLSPLGYGKAPTRSGATALVHRRLYIALIADVPDDRPLDHLCRTPACANPLHLEPVTSRENALRGIGFPAARARQTHCIHGHEFTPENTYIHRSRGTRNCRRCFHLRYLMRRDGISMSQALARAG